MGRTGGVELRKVERQRTHMRWRLAQLLSEITGEGVLKCARKLRKATRSASTRHEPLEVRGEDGIRIVHGAPDLF